jgi:WD40 repeat protein
MINGNRVRSVSMLTIAITAAALVFSYEKTFSQESATVASIDFQQHVMPLLQKHCVACHSAEEQGGGVQLDSFTALQKGGEHGALVTASEPASSRLWLVVSGQLEPKMPPDDRPGLDEAELAVLERWIREGAVGPSDVEPSPSMLSTPKIVVASQIKQPISAISLFSPPSSPQTQLLAVARGGNIELVNAARLQSVLTLVSGLGKINDLAFSPDGAQLIVATGIAGLAGKVLLIDVEDGTILREFSGHRDIVYSARMSPDGKLLATAGYDREILLWDTASGQVLRKLRGHNGAVFQLAFSHDGQVLASASGDETVKLWRVSDGARLDTLSQPQGEVWTVAFSPDNRFIVAGSSDNRFRVWQFTSHSEPMINPLLETRFADEAALVRIAFSGDSQYLLVASQEGRVRAYETTRWNKVGNVADCSDFVSGLAIAGDNGRAFIATMSGDLVEQPLHDLAKVAEPTQVPLEEIFFTMDSLSEVMEPSDKEHNSAATAWLLPRGARVAGVIDKAVSSSSSTSAGEVDWYRFSARRGEVWMIETRASQDGSPLDTVIEVCDETGGSLTQARLQAVRDTYFTFRGKDSTQSNDFRLFAWEEMELNDFLYSKGEVTRLWMYPRGPDSGFNVYPGTGTRHTFFGTSPVAHALQDPAYIVRPLTVGQLPADNGLPVFEVPYRNDDDPSRQIGTDSRIRFVAPDDGDFAIRVADSRGQGGTDYKYQLTVRPAAPDFVPHVDWISKPIPASGGREFRVHVTRRDDFDGPITFEIEGISAPLQVTRSVTIERGQHEAYGVVWAAKDLVPGEKYPAPTVIARAEILGRTVIHSVPVTQELLTAERPAIVVRVSNVDDPTPVSDQPLRLRAGDTMAAWIHLERYGNDDEVKLGNEYAGRNMAHGVFVDNIGLNGLMVLKGSTRHQFFITAAPIAAPGVRLFHLKAEIDGGVTSVPVALEILPIE